MRLPDPTGNPHGRWRVWDLDAELRYVPVVRALPDPGAGPVCEIGSGPAGLAAWTDHRVLGVDPGADEMHGTIAERPNFERLTGDGASVPLPDGAAACTVAVDTFEHIPPAARGAVVDEMLRVTAGRGRVIIMGPTGADAAKGDRYVLERFRARDPGNLSAVWLGEHFDNGLPTVEELVGYLGHERVARVSVRGVFNLGLWRTMYRALLGDFPQVKGERYVHHLLWAPYGWLARRLHRGPYYRYLVVADLHG